MPGTGTPEAMRAALADHYAGSAVVAMGEPPADGEMLLRGSDAGSDRLELFVFANADARQPRLVARLDNLGKVARVACVHTPTIMAHLPEQHDWHLRHTSTAKNS